MMMMIILQSRQMHLVLEEYHLLPEFFHITPVFLLENNLLTEWVAGGVISFFFCCLLLEFKLLAWPQVQVGYASMTACLWLAASPRQGAVLPCAGVKGKQITS